MLYKWWERRYRMHCSYIFFERLFASNHWHIWTMLVSAVEINLRWKPTDYHRLNELPFHRARLNRMGECVLLSISPTYLRHRCESNVLCSWGRSVCYNNDNCLIKFPWTITDRPLSRWNVATMRLSHNMMTSSNGNIFRVTGPLCGEFTVNRWIPLTKASVAELWCFLSYAPEQTVEQTIETHVIWDITPSRWLWYRCNEYHAVSHMSNTANGNFTE